MVNILQKRQTFFRIIVLVILLTIVYNLTLLLRNPLGIASLRSQTTLDMILTIPTAAEIRFYTGLREFYDTETLILPPSFLDGTRDFHIIEINLRDLAGDIQLKVEETNIAQNELDDLRPDLLYMPAVHDRDTDLYFWLPAETTHHIETLKAVWIDDAIYVVPVEEA